MRLFLAAAFVAAVCLSGCASSQMKYTPEEIRDYPPAVQEHIKNGEIATGMTMQQVRYSWGGPDEVRVLAPSDDGKDRTEWVYRTKLGVFKTRLVFSGDKLSEILSSEPGSIK